MIQWNDLLDKLSKYFNSSKGIIYIIAPFIQRNYLEKILQSINNSPVNIVTSWRFDHLLTGASTLDIYTVVRNHNCNLYINDRLHLKLYSTSLESAWIGSANLTERAFSDTEISNIEGLTLINMLSSFDRIEIQKIIANSIYVTDGLYQAIKDWLERQEPLQIPTESIPDVIFKNKDYHFLTSQLPASLSPTRFWEVANFPEVADADWGEEAAMEHDIALYDVSPNKSKNQFFEELKIRFFTHPFIKALEENITKEGIHFGGLKEWVQKNCTDVPVPYRRELTPHVRSLMGWFVELNPNSFEMIQPNISQILKRKRE